MLESVSILKELGYDLYASMGTADFYQDHGINVRIYLYLYLQYTYVRTYLHIRSYAIYVCNIILIHTQKYLILFNLIIIRISICAVIITYMAMYVYSMYKTWLLRILVNIL